MARYAVWNKEDTIYTPVGEALTPEQWIGRYGWMNNPAAVPVVAAGLINGAFCGELNEMKNSYENMGADFSGCTTNEEILGAIEAFENQMNTPSTEPSAEERIAAAMEYQNLLSL
nr:MAG TPA: hypothetical protein [Caudoviricetes sp.]